ncbi:hypothetical protein GCM10028826_17970 [Mucilaginibacter boryungensis]
MVGNWNVTYEVDYGGNSPTSVTLSDCQKSAVLAFGQGGDFALSTNSCAPPPKTIIGGSWTMDSSSQLTVKDGTGNVAFQGTVAFSNGNNICTLNEIKFEGYVLTFTRK